MSDSYIPALIMSVADIAPFFVINIVIFGGEKPKARSIFNI